MSAPRGLTLIECLIGIAAVSLLIQLLLPAIQAVREASRRTTCQDNLRKIGVANGQHIEATGSFPSGGWGFLWVGDPERGSDRRQPGGWIFNLLPYLGYESLHDFGLGQVGDQRLVSIKRVCQTPLAEFVCPSRRPVVIHPCEGDPIIRNADWHRFAAKSDYAANGGDHYLGRFEGPMELAEGDSGSYTWPDNSKLNGIVYLRSEVSPVHVVDGMGKTFFAGEKYLDARYYFDGNDAGDDRPMYIGFDNNTIRWTSPPRRDAARSAMSERFGSAHPDGCHFLYCDGSLRTISFDVDVTVSRAAGSRRDNAP